MSYTTLNGMTAFSDTDLTSIIKQNVIAFFDWGFLDAGAFTNIKLTDADIRGNNRSTLAPVKDPAYVNGRVWQAFRQNLVWESGVTVAVQPINISGVYVNGSFKTPTASGFSHYVDYRNGRVVFDQPITASSVRMEYSFKNILIDSFSVSPTYQEVQTRTNDIGTTFTASSGSWGLLAGGKAQLPIISIFTSPNITYRPLEMGNDSKYAQVDVICKILTEDDNMSIKLGTICSSQENKVIYLFDPDKVAASGAFSLDRRGAKINGITYPQLVKDPSEGGFRYNKLYFKQAFADVSQNLGNNAYLATTRLTTEVITIK